MSQSFLQTINDVLVALRQTQVTDVDSSTISTITTLFANQVKTQVEDACMWRAHRHTETVTMAAGLVESAAVITDSNERSLIYDIPGQRARLFDTTEFDGDSSRPKRRMWATPIDRVRELQDLNASQTAGVDYPSRLAVDIDSTNVGVILHREIVSTQSNTYEVDLWTPQATLAKATQTTVLKVPHLPVVWGTAWMVTQERGEELGIDGNMYRELYVSALRDAVSKEVDGQGGWTVESEAGYWDVVRRQY
jgi:hypothetical protein